MAVRPTAANTSSAARPQISCPLPHVRSMSVAFKRIPRSRPSGTRPIGTGPVKKSSAVAVDSGSRSKGSPSGIRMSPLWAKTSASRPGACGGGLQYRLSARSRRLAAISVAGRSAQRRASSSIARSWPPGPPPRPCPCLRPEGSPSARPPSLHPTPRTDWGSLTAPHQDRQSDPRCSDALAP